MFLRPGRKHRSYQYTPRFYKPEVPDPTERKQIRFKRNVRSQSNRSLLWTLVAILCVIYFIFYFNSSGF